MVKRIRFILLAALLAFGLTSNGWAELFAVGPSNPAAVGNSQFPAWYQDFADPAASPDANPNYGIGPTPGGLTLELCLDLNTNCFAEGVPAAPLDLVNNTANFPDEAFWWAAEAIVPTSTGQALLVLALEAAFASDAAAVGQEISFGRIRIRVDVPANGTYTVTHPFGVQVFTVTDATAARAINFTEDIGIGAPGVFTGALASNIGPFLFWDAGLPITDPALAGAFYIGDGATPHKVLGSPFGTNIFRVDGPPGSNLDGAGNSFIQTDLFAVTGKVFTAGGTANTAPVAVADTAATLVDTPVVIDVIGNDTFTDVPINPGSLTFTVPPANGTAAMTIVDGQVRVTYTPNAGFTGEDTFTYTVTGFAGMVSNPATVTVTVEDLRVNKAEFRPKFLKWRVTGTSSDTTANTIGIQVGPPTVSTTLSGAQEIPPVITTGSGSASVTVGETSINFTLSISGLLNITSTHLHLGAPGTDGPVLFTIAGPNVTSVPNGILRAVDLTPQPALGINTFADAANAILSGNTYIQVHTQTRPAGELRGQLGPVRLVGFAPVQGTGTAGTWSFDGKSTAFPTDTRTISVRSSNGVQVLDVPLKVK